MSPSPFSSPLSSPPSSPLSSPLSSPPPTPARRPAARSPFSSPLSSPPPSPGVSRPVDATPFSSPLSSPPPSPGVSRPVDATPFSSPLSSPPSSSEDVEAETETVEYGADYSMDETEAEETDDDQRSLDTNRRSSPLKQLRFVETVEVVTFEDDEWSDEASESGEEEEEDLVGLNPAQLTFVLIGQTLRLADPTASAPTVAAAPIVSAPTSGASSNSATSNTTSLGANAAPEDYVKWDLCEAGLSTSAGPSGSNGSGLDALLQNGYIPEVAQGADIYEKGLQAYRSEQACVEERESFISQYYCPCSSLSYIID
ncbi:hypothetical protein D9611_002871 [Ephemerocybe angulata]|uniref:Uncharacterized protein n=1 Tax=Ephemerocybe angulata TaxID=980116 RepID=A0A8H5FI29_9AGAR|nr:hypothetical protein D9611_002871 [Tulosesus angulatus]